mgnify:CR=1 FL=1
MDAPGKLQDRVPAVTDHSGRHVEEPVADRLEELMPVDTRQGEPFYPVGEVIGDYLRP